MLALMKPSNVATRSSTRGTSFGATVVTRTSAGGGPVCADLREQPVANDRPIRTAAAGRSGFIDSTIADRELYCREQMQRELPLIALLVRELESRRPIMLLR